MSRQVDRQANSGGSDSAVKRRRPSGFFRVFNKWVLGHLLEDRRPSSRDIARWHAENAETVFGDAAPTLPELVVQAKGLKLPHIARAVQRVSYQKRKERQLQEKLQRRRLEGNDGSSSDEATSGAETTDGGSWCSSPRQRSRRPSSSGALCDALRDDNSDAGETQSLPSPKRRDTGSPNSGSRLPLINHMAWQSLQIMGTSGHEPSSPLARATGADGTVRQAFGSAEGRGSRLLMSHHSTSSSSALHQARSPIDCPASGSGRTEAPSDGQCLMDGRSSAPERACSPALKQEPADYHDRLLMRHHHLMGPTARVLQHSAPGALHSDMQWPPPQQEQLQEQQQQQNYYTGLEGCGGPSRRCTDLVGHYFGDEQLDATPFAMILDAPNSPPQGALMDDGCGMHIKQEEGCADRMYRSRASLGWQGGMGMGVGGAGRSAGYGMQPEPRGARSSGGVGRTSAGGGFHAEGPNSAPSTCSHRTSFVMPALDGPGSGVDELGVSMLLGEPGDTDALLLGDPTTGGPPACSSHMPPILETREDGSLGFGDFDELLRQQQAYEQQQRMRQQEQLDEMQMQVQHQQLQVQGQGQFVQQQEFGNGNGSGGDYRLLVYPQCQQNGQHQGVHQQERERQHMMALQLNSMLQPQQHHLQHQSCQRPEPGPMSADWALLQPSPDSTDFMPSTAASAGMDTVSSTLRPPSTLRAINTCGLASLNPYPIAPHEGLPMQMPQPNAAETGAAGANGGGGLGLRDPQAPLLPQQQSIPWMSLGDELDNLMEGLYKDRF